MLQGKSNSGVGSSVVAIAQKMEADWTTVQAALAHDEADLVQMPR